MSEPHAVKRFLKAIYEFLGVAGENYYVRVHLAPVLVYAVIYLLPLPIPHSMVVVAALAASNTAGLPQQEYNTRLA